MYTFIAPFIPYVSKHNARNDKRSSLQMRGPTTPPPSYVHIDSNPANKVFTSIFLSKLEAELGRKSEKTGYAGVIATVNALAQKHRRDSTALQAASERVLLSLFPGWLPPAFAWLFSRNVPQWAAWINAVVTVGVTQWLMGPSKINGNVVEIERCRYLEETDCVGVCVNSCKKATEAFFDKYMGLPLYIQPDFKDYSCKFQFGEVPPNSCEDEAYREPCFATCSRFKGGEGNSACGLIESGKGLK